MSAPAPEPEERRSLGQMIAAPFKAFGRGFNVGATSTVPRLAGNFMEALGDLGREGTPLDLVGDKGSEVEAFAERRGEELADRYGPSESFREAPVSWLAENLGQAIPTMLPIIAASAGGAVVGGPPGAVAGGLAAGGAMGAGDIHGELEDAGMEPGAARTALTFGGAVPYAAAERVVPGRVGGKLVTGAAKRGFGPLFQEAMRSGVEEGITEAAQSAISQGAAAIGTGQDIDWQRIGEEAVRGAAAGPFFGAGGHALASRREGRQEPTEDVFEPEPLPPEFEPATVEPIADPTTGQPVTEPVVEPVAEPVTEPVLEAITGETAVTSPVMEPVRQPDIEAAREPKVPIEWTEGTIAPEPGAVPPKRQRSVFPGDDRKVETEYQVVEADRLRASHTPGFAQRPAHEFPPEIQGRAYHGRRGRQAREHTEQIVTHFDPERALDPTLQVSEGPPVVTPSGIVVAGNGRTIAQQRLYESRPEAAQAFKTAIMERAGEFGIDPAVVAGMERPVVVRRITDPAVDVADVSTLRELNTSSDQPVGKTKDPLSQAATKAAAFREARGALEHFATTADPEATINSYLGTKDGREFLAALVDDGVITKAERAGFIDANTGVPTDEGKKLVERMFYLAALGDADTVSRAPAAVLRKLDTSLPAIIRADQAGGDWEIGGLVREALDLLATARASDLKLVDLVSQTDFERPAPPADVVSMAEFLDSKKATVRDAFRAYANQAEEATRQVATHDMFGYEPPPASEGRGVFRRAALEPLRTAAQAQIDIFGFEAAPAQERQQRRERLHQDQTSLFGERNPELAEGWTELGEINGRFAFRDPEGRVHTAPTNELEQATGLPKGVTGGRDPEWDRENVRAVEDPEGSPNMFSQPQEQGGIFGLTPLGTEDQAGSPSRVPSTGTPSRASIFGDAGGMAMTRPAGSSDLTQPSSGPFQTSDQPRSVFSSPTSRNTAPSPRDAGSTTFTITKTPEGRDVLQPSEDAEGLLEAAKELRPSYDTALREVAQAIPGITLTPPRVKAQERLQEKLADRPVATISDFLGGRIGIETMAAGQQAIEALEAKGWRLPDGEAADESFHDAGGKGGYRARHVQLLSPDGRLTVELQLVPREIYEVQKEAHKHYRVFRDSEFSLKERQAAKDKSQRMFDGAWQKFQKRVTSTPEFRRWFKGSKVVDSDGKPMPVFHFGRFKGGTPTVEGVEGMHFGTRRAALDRGADKLRDTLEEDIYMQEDVSSPYAAAVKARGIVEDLYGGPGRRHAAYPPPAFDFDALKSEGQVTEVYLSLEKPLRIRDAGAFHRPNELWESLPDDWDPPAALENSARAFFDAGLAGRVKGAYAYDELSPKEQYLWRQLHEEIKSAVEAEGYDGYVYKNRQEDRGSDSFVVFHPEQVKSVAAISFDPASPDISKGDMAASPNIFVPDEAKGTEQARPPMVPPGIHPLAPTAQLSSRQLRAAGEFREGTATEAPKATEIIRELHKALDKALDGVKLAEGGDIFKRALAVVTPRSQVVRSRSISDVPAIGHEFGHLMQKLIFGGDADGSISDRQLAALPGAVRGELQDLGKGTSDESVTEGWAEFFRRYLDNPSSLDAEAANARRWIEDRLLEHPGMQAAWEEAREQWQLHRDASPQARVRSHISVGEKNPEVMSIANKVSRFRVAMIDNYEPIRQVMRHIREGSDSDITLQEDAETLARLTRGSTGIADMIMGEKRGDRFIGGMVDFATGERVGKSFTELLDPVKDKIDDFRDYAVSRRAIELHKRGKLTGIEDADAKWTVNHLDNAEFRKAFDDLQEFNAGLLKYLADAGVISHDTVAEYQKHNREYVPFYRVHEGGLFGLGKGFGNLWNPMKRLKGSGRDIIDPLESTIKNAYSYVHLAQKQRVSTALAALAEKEGVGHLLEKVLTPMRPTQFSLGEIAKDLEEVMPGADRLIENLKDRGVDPKEEMLAIFRPGDLLGKPNTISVLKNGKREWFETDPELYRALTGMDNEQLDGWVRWLSKPARWLRAGATLAPEFLIRNPLRDQVMGFIQSEYGYKPFWDLGRGIIELVKKGEAYEQFMVSGAERGTIVGLDRDSQQRNLKKLLDSGGVPNVLKNPLDILRALSELMENGTRMGEFLNARKQLEGDPDWLNKAGAAAREISIDFGTHGAKTMALRNMSAFWNARMLGYDKLVRTAKQDPLKFAARTFVSITLPSILEYYANRDDEDYWELPQWQRDIFWIIKVGDTQLRIPKPFELGLIFGTLPIRILSAVDGTAPGGAEETREFLKNFGKDALSIVPAPTALMPLAEGVTNWSFFLQRPIVPRGELNVRAREQGGEYTSDVAKLLARWSPGPQGISPRKIDNLLHSWTGGLGRLATESRDLARHVVRDGPAKPAPTLADIPGVRGIVARAPGLSSESVERLYRRLERSTTAVGTLNHFKREHRWDEFRREARDPKQAELRARHDLYQGTADTIHKIRAMVEMVTRDPNMSPHEKRNRIRELGKEAIEVARGALRD